MVENDDPATTQFTIALDDETVAMLIELSESCHCSPAQLAAAIVRDVLVDDFAAHGGNSVYGDGEPPTTTH